MTAHKVGMGDLCADDQIHPTAVNWLFDRHRYAHRMGGLQQLQLGVLDMSTTIRSRMLAASRTSSWAFGFSSRSASLWHCTTSRKPDSSPCSKESSAGPPFFATTHTGAFVCWPPGGSKFSLPCHVCTVGLWRHPSNWCKSTTWGGGRERGEKGGGGQRVGRRGVRASPSFPFWHTGGSAAVADAASGSPRSQG